MRDTFSARSVAPAGPEGILVTTSQGLLRATKEGLANGQIDIVVGTHALLSKSVEFKNLGLLVVDEEQHFGVAHKERLKELRGNIHVLTLTATPIPRTLQLALTGVRHLVLLESDGGARRLPDHRTQGQDRAEE